MISNIQDKTSEFNADSGFKADVSEWETVTVQFVNPSGTVNITGTNDSNAITGVSDGGALMSTNYTAIQAVALGTGTAAATLNASGLYKITVACKFIQFSGTGITADKVILFQTKPY
jgi:hypothetical protein